MRGPRFLLLFPALVFLLGGCASTSELTGGGDPHVGARLFVQEQCVTCHIVNGVGDTAATPLTDDLSAINYPILRAAIQHPPPGMEVTRSLGLTPRQMHDLAAFAASSLKPVSR